jgi:hypothetical protein
MKNRILLDNHYLLGELEQSIAEFVVYYKKIAEYCEGLDRLIGDMNRPAAFAAEFA